MNSNQLRGDDASVVERVAAQDLPPALDDLASTYETTVGLRDRFLWQWIYALLPEVTLSTVPETHAEQARTAKTAMSMLVVLLDDLGERDLDRATLTEAAKVPFEGQTPVYDAPGVDGDTVAFAERIWAVVDEILAGPRTEEFSDVLAFDLRQTVTAIEYSYLVNHHLEMATLEETWLYDTHNMMLFTYADVDLAFSPSFDRTDLGALRTGLRRTQRMARIGNWITTWEREIAEGDYTSGVVVDALTRGIVSVGELTALRAGDESVDSNDVIERIRAHDIDTRFLEQWESERQSASEFGEEIGSVDFEDYLDGMETVMEFHLASRGLK